jgi:hypothetical protein
MLIMSSRFTLEIFRRVFDPLRGDLPESLAHYLLAVRVSPADQQRVDELSAKARAGTLTADEDEELEGYLEVDNFLSIMQSKARVTLRIPPPTVVAVPS